MAIWAKWMFFASIVGIPIAILGLIYIRRTLLEARLTTAAALEGAEISREIGQAQVRAYLDISTGAFESYSNLHKIMLNIRNAGASPALGIQASFRLLHEIAEEEGVDPVWHVLDFGPVPVDDITATATHELTIGIPPGDDETEYGKVWGAIWSKHWFKLICKMSWTDVFGEQNTKEFRLSVVDPSQVHTNARGFVGGKLARDSSRTPRIRD